MSNNATRFARTHKHEVISGQLAPMRLDVTRREKSFKVIELPRYPGVAARCGDGSLTFWPTFYSESYRMKRRVVTLGRANFALYNQKF